MGSAPRHIRPAASTSAIQWGRPARRVCVSRLLAGRWVFVVRPRITPGKQAAASHPTLYDRPVRTPSSVASILAMFFVGVNDEGCGWMRDVDYDFYG